VLVSHAASTDQDTSTPGTDQPPAHYAMAKVQQTRDSLELLFSAVSAIQAFEETSATTDLKSLRSRRKAAECAENTGREQIERPC
jgi:hypothetical protein